jgi:hypothetical protein
MLAARNILSLSHQILTTNMDLTGRSPLMLSLKHFFTLTLTNLRQEKWDEHCVDLDQRCCLWYVAGYSRARLGGSVTLLVSQSANFYLFTTNFMRFTSTSSLPDATRAFPSVSKAWEDVTKVYINDA